MCRDDSLQQLGLHCASQFTRFLCRYQRTDKITHVFTALITWRIFQTILSPVNVSGTGWRVCALYCLFQALDCTLFGQKALLCWLIPDCFVCQNVTIKEDFPCAGGTGRGRCCVIKVCSRSLLGAFYAWDAVSAIIVFNNILSVLTVSPVVNVSRINHVQKRFNKLFCKYNIFIFE